MKKIFAVLLTAALLVTAFAGCGSKNGGSVTIAVPNDATNEARALLLLESKGYIKLKDGATITATVNDIAENPHNIKFQEIEAAQQRRFAAAGRADNGDRLALFEREIDALQDDGILVEAFFQVSDFQNRHTAASLRLEIVEFLFQLAERQRQKTGEDQIINAREEQRPDGS